MHAPLTLWIDFPLNNAQAQRLRETAPGRELVLLPDAADSELSRAHVAFGQPPVRKAIESPSLRWVQLSSAGYSGFDQPEARTAFRERGTVLTKSSLVYANPCAEHVLAFMLAWARQLPVAWEVQLSSRAWKHGELRESAFSLDQQKVVLVGFGAIGQRLAELLAPLTRQVVAVRRQVRGDEPLETLSMTDPGFSAALQRADHVVNLLPDNSETRGFFDVKRLAQIKPGAVFYNVGRGTTVDQSALVKLLEMGHLQAALLDVTYPEPLPADDPLWKAPRCYITPHMAGGHQGENDRLFDHFVGNFQRFVRSEPLLDRAY